MMGRKSDFAFAATIFVSCFFFCMAAAFGSFWQGEAYLYDRIAAVTAAFPDRQSQIAGALKETEEGRLAQGREILARYGYHGHLPAGHIYAALGAGAFVAAGMGTAGALYATGRKKKGLKKRAENLTEYLRQVEEGSYFTFPERSQDFLSNLEDEIYKTVLALRESRERLKQEKENQARSFTDISHQLKTPLTSLSVLCELLAHRVTEPEAGLQIQKMEGQIERISELTAALLTLARAEAGVLSFEIRRIPVGELISCGLESLWPLIEKKGQRIKLWGEEDIYLSCDLGWMKEALGSLLKNASEHSPEGTEICVRVLDNPVYTGIAIEDEGMGFDSKDLPHLFERFYRGNTVGKGGTGIGLSLAKSLIESQGGEIRGENRREGGARFVILFYKNM